MKDSKRNMNRKHHLKIVKPFRFFVFVLICVTVTVFAGYLIFGHSEVDAASETRYAEVLVQDNDTLWSIINTYNSDKDVDIRTAIYDVYEANNIDSADIKPGDVLLIPVY